VPRFSHIYEDIGGDMPWLTRMLMAWGRIVEARGGMILAAVLAAIVGLVMWLRQPASRQRLARLFMRIPAIGERACGLPAHALLPHAWACC
jgi:general secretion pathway protein F